MRNGVPILPVSTAMAHKHIKENDWNQTSVFYVFKRHDKMDLAVCSCGFLSDEFSVGSTHHLIGDQSRRSMGYGTIQAIVPQPAMLDYEREQNSKRGGGLKSINFACFK